MSELVRGVEMVLIDGGSRPIETVRSSVIGLVGTSPDADEQALPLNTPKLFVGNPRALKAAVLPNGVGDGGTLIDSVETISALTSAVIVVVRVEDTGGSVAQDLLGDAASRTGIWALLNAKAVTGVQPRLLAAPCPDGYTYDSGKLTAAPLATALGEVAERLRAIAVVDGPNTDATEANQAVNAIGNKRVFVIDPWIQNLNGEEVPPSALGVALFNKSDNAESRGYWWSPSNWPVLGAVVSGTSRPIDYTPGDAACEADVLAGYHVNTIINEDGWRLWGCRVAQTTDSKWRQVTRVRIADLIADSIRAAHQWALDRPITPRFVEEVVEGVNAYLRSLKSRNVIADGSAWADGELNPASELELGHLTISFDFCDNPLAEKITFQYELNTDYLEATV